MRKTTGKVINLQRNIYWFRHGEKTYYNSFIQKIKVYLFHLKSKIHRFCFIISYYLLIRTEI